MAILQLVPATKLSAFYNPHYAILTLGASGESDFPRFAIKFERRIILGGLLFDLNAWVDPVRTGPVEPYEKSQDFRIPNLRVVCPDNKVLIKTANQPQGELVEITWGGLNPPDPPKSEVNGASSTGQGKGDQVARQPQVIDREVETITVFWGQDFAIKATPPISPEGSLDAKYEATALALKSAKIQFGNLEWTFAAQQVGTTYIVVESSRDFGLLIRTYYKIDVIVLEDAAAATRIVAGNTKDDKEDEDLSFRGRVKVATAIVRRTAPEAELLIVKAKLPPHIVFPVDDPNYLSHLLCYFSTKDGSARIHSPGRNVWLPPVFSKDPILGAQPFDIEKDVPIDIVGAVRKIKDAKIAPWFFGATLNKPLTEPSVQPKEPSYSFEMRNATTVSVGAQTGEVTVSPGPLVPALAKKA
ncbi:uncharacterized protein KY384_002220 [Bacidia gigantensis]|uniref:uncharacterized protein n=1 Tax=Bacidia gigantensis TaxID=2732470 RepID=UPI001D0599D9|nr:uncharacterized protein KY384_002220 [Bacidia gigantensis]KAG8533437.1 hypothetical protein KY384_002220 [Bacidia gigantensis]